MAPATGARDTILMSRTFQVSAPLSEPNSTAANPSNSTSDTGGPVLVPTKIHLRGVDILTTDDIKAYASENSGAADRIEWIDDTSANLVYSSEGRAQGALIALCAMPIADPTQLPILECLPAKPLSTKPDVSLQVRVAVSTDRKQVGAAARSRFYLLHPEYDPEERRKREQADRSRYRSRDDRYRPGPRWRSEYDGEDDFNKFEPSFYDDPQPDRRRSPPGDSIRRIRRRSPGADFSRQRNSTKELFPSRRREDASRDRSASPARDALDDNRSSAQRVKRRLSATSGPKELFPSKADASNLTQLDQLELTGGSEASNGAYSVRGSALRSSGNDDFALKGASTTRVKELFPDKFGDNVGKELFAGGTEGRGKRRQKAEDLFR